MGLTLTMPLTGGQRAAAEETYADSLPVIEKTVGAFCRAYGGDYDELRANADTIFMEAFHRYDDSKPWHTWLNEWIWFELFDAMRVAARRAARAPMIGGEAVDALTYGTDFDMELFMEGLGADAVTVIKLTFDTPTDLAEAVERKGGEPRNLRSTLREYLKGLGWTARRVRESFAEIKEALG